MFFSGTLQEGIARAVQEAKAVICFVQDNSQTSLTWQEEYFTGDEAFTQKLETRSVLLRIIKDSSEAGFLASVCPVSQYPTVVVIRNGMVQEYIVPEVSKDEFRSRLTAALDDRKSQPQTAASSTAQQTHSQNQGADSSPAQAPEPVVTTPAPTAVAAQTSSTSEVSSHDTPRSASAEKKKVVNEGTPGGSGRFTAQTPRKQNGESKSSLTTSKAKGNSHTKVAKEETPNSRKPKDAKSTGELPANRPRPIPGLPAQYRLQIRLFDGSSVRSTFSPSQTIRKDVRSWLDGQMEERSPYNFKHILTPSPNRTLTIAEEEQPLRELIVGSTATFVIIPVKSYIEAYSESGSLPVQALSSLYGIISSIIGNLTSYVSSLLGYGQTQASPSQSEPLQSFELQSSNDNVRRRRPFGPNIRTLRDQEAEQDPSQFYNGNQLNFEPRQDDEQ